MPRTSGLGQSLNSPLLSAHDVIGAPNVRAPLALCAESDSARSAGTPWPWRNFMAMAAGSAAVIALGEWLDGGAAHGGAAGGVGHDGKTSGGTSRGNEGDAGSGPGAAPGDAGDVGNQTSGEPTPAVTAAARPDAPDAGTEQDAGSGTLPGANSEWESGEVPPALPLPGTLAPSGDARPRFPTLPSILIGAGSIERVSTPPNGVVGDDAGRLGPLSSTVPEPQTEALMAAGLVGIVVATSRRQMRRR